jgi:cyclophilin family peptidyl-prolyl cis-trans isomerase
MFAMALMDVVSGQAPFPPTGCQGTALDRDTIELGWFDNSLNEDGFLIEAYHGETGEFYGSLSTGAGVGSGFVSLPIDGFSGGRSYIFRVYAFIGSPPNRDYSNHAQSSVVQVPDQFLRFGHQATVGVWFSIPLEFTDEFGLLDSVTVTGMPAWMSQGGSPVALIGTAVAPGAYPVTVTVDYLDGFQMVETVTLRVIAAASGPVAEAAMPAPVLRPGGAVEMIDLDAHFDDPDTPRAVRMNMSTGIFDIILYEQAAPATVANFLAYVNAVGQGSYDGAVVHRSAWQDLDGNGSQETPLVIQGGGYRPTGGWAFESVTDLAPVVNEPGLDNVEGTLAMAKQGGNPDSATNEWFVSLGDNRANLDYQNEGFSVFGRVAGEGMTEVDEIAALPRGDYPTITVDGFARPGLMSSCPMAATTAPETMEQDKLVTIVSAAEVAPIAYEVVSVSGSAVASAGVNGSDLEITPLEAGTCVIVVRGTDLDDNLLERSLTVTVEWSFADWVAGEGLTAGEDGAGDDPDMDRSDNLLEYGLFGDPLVAGGSLAEGQRVIDGDEYLAVAFSVRKGAADVVIRVEAANSPEGTWTEVWNSTQGFGHAQVVSAANEGESTDLVVRDTAVLGSAGARFLRVRVERLP